MHRPRIIPSYNALRDAAHRWPGWRFRPTKLHGPEKVIVADQKLVLFEESLDHEKEVAQGVAHLDLGHHEDEDGDDNVGRLPMEAQAEALWLAEVRLDGERSWGVAGLAPDPDMPVEVEVDGDPTTS